jgi:hypothetical protein
MTTTPRPHRLPLHEAANAIRRRETFVAGDGSLSGAHCHPTEPPELGKLTEGRRVQLGQAWRLFADRLYIVWSYGTPIAYTVPGLDLFVYAAGADDTPTTLNHRKIAREATR